MGCLLVQVVGFASVLSGYDIVVLFPLMIFPPRLLSILFNGVFLVGFSRGAGLLQRQFMVKFKQKRKSREVCS